MTKRVVDLFCGVGGLTHGFILEGFDVALGIDSDPSCRFPYEHNNNVRFLNAKVEELTESDKANLFPAENGLQDLDWLCPLPTIFELHDGQE